MIFSCVFSFGFRCASATLPPFRFICSLHFSVHSRAVVRGVPDDDPGGRAYWLVNQLGPDVVSLLGAIMGQLTLVLFLHMSLQLRTPIVRRPCKRGSHVGQTAVMNRRVSKRDLSPLTRFGFRFISPTRRARAKTNTHKYNKDNDNDHLFSEISVRKALPCPEGLCAWRSVQKELCLVLLLRSRATWNEVGLYLCWKGSVVHSECVCR